MIGQVPREEVAINLCSFALEKKRGADKLSVVVHMEAIYLGVSLKEKRELVLRSQIESSAPVHNTICTLPSTQEKKTSLNVFYSKSGCLGRG